MCIFVTCAEEKNKKKNTTTRLTTRTTTTTGTRTTTTTWVINSFVKSLDNDVLIKASFLLQLIINRETEFSPSDKYPSFNKRSIKMFVETCLKIQKYAILISHFKKVHEIYPQQFISLPCRQRGCGSSGDKYKFKFKFQKIIKNCYAFSFLNNFLKVLKILE